VLVDFNDKYDAALPTFSVERLGDDLSRLGEQLAGRFELEDALIRLLQERGGS
jgi:regulator of sigma D